MKKVLTIDDEVPFFMFDVPQILIDTAFNGALELRYYGDGKDRDPIVSNLNSMGESIETEMGFVSYTAAHEINKNINALVDYLKKQCNHISKTYYALDIEFEPVNSSVLFYETGSMISSHNHFPFAFVSAVYLNIDVGASPIILGKDTKVKPYAGLGIIFPGHLKHEVETTTEKRIMCTVDWKSIL